MIGIQKFNPKAKKRAHGGERERNAWKAELQTLIDRYAGLRVNGNTASFRTRAFTAETLFAAFRTLHEELGMTPRPANFKEDHVGRLVQHWYYTRNKQINTIKNELSILRKFSKWIGKPNMVKPLDVYLPDVDPEALVVRAATTKSKAWSTNGINVAEKIEQAFALNERFGLMLLCQVTFGLRMQEALLLRPWKAHSFKGLMVFPGAGPKGGRPRLIPFLIPEQIVVLETLVKPALTKAQSLAWEQTRRGKPASLKYCIENYYACCRQIGITKKDADVVGHGLRAEFAINMARVKGFDPVTEEFTGEQPEWEERQELLKEVSEMMGHSRPQIMGSYFGVFKREPGKSVEYVGRARDLVSKTNGSGSLASTSAKRSVAPDASVPGKDHTALLGKTVISSKVEDDTGAPPTQHNGVPKKERASIASLVARFKAPEYRGRGRVTTHQNDGDGLGIPRGRKDVDRTAEERQMKLQFPFAVVPRKPVGSDRS